MCLGCFQKQPPAYGLIVCWTFGCRKQHLAYLFSMFQVGKESSSGEASGAYVKARHVASKTCSLWVSGGPLWVGREEGTFFLNSCISDALRLNSKVWLIFWQNASRVPRLTKKMQLILMEWYKRKVGIMANYQSYLIQAICRHFFLKEKESKRVREVCREYVWDSQIIEDVFHRARKTPERNPWSQVSRRDNFTIFVMPNKLSELRQR